MLSSYLLFVFMEITPNKMNGSKERKTKIDEICKLKSYTDGGNVERNLHKYRALNSRNAVVTTGKMVLKEKRLGSKSNFTCTSSVKS